MLTTAERDVILNTYTSHFVGWLSAIANWRTGSVTELSYSGYARAAVTFGSPTDTSPAGGRQRANSSAATGGQKSDVGTVDAIGWGIYAASSGGSPKWIGLMDADVPVVGTADESSDAITAPAHGLSTDQRVFVLAAPGAVIPTGLSENTAYFVLASGLTTDAFKLSTSSGGAAVNITAKGAALFMPYTALTIAQLATPQFDTGALILQI